MGKFLFDLLFKAVAGLCETHIVRGSPYGEMRVDKGRGSVGASTNQELNPANSIISTRGKSCVCLAGIRHFFILYHRHLMTAHFKITPRLFFFISYFVLHKYPPSPHLSSPLSEPNSNSFESYLWIGQSYLVVSLSQTVHKIFIYKIQILSPDRLTHNDISKTTAPMTTKFFRYFPLTP